MTPAERKHTIEVRLREALQPLTLIVTDESHLHVGHPGAQAGGSHFAVEIIAEQFTGKSLIQRHQLVYEALKDLIPHEVHALKIKAKCPCEFS